MNNKKPKTMETTYSKINHMKLACPFMTYFIHEGNEIIIITKYTENEETTSQVVFATHSNLNELKDAEKITDEGEISAIKFIGENIRENNITFKQIKL